jgi:hypothetical protein
MDGACLGGGVHKKLVPAAVQSEKIESEGSGSWDHAARAYHIQSCQAVAPCKRHSHRWTDCFKVLNEPLGIMG